MIPDAIVEGVTRIANYLRKKKGYPSISSADVRITLEAYLMLAKEFSDETRGRREDSNTKQT